jgi:S1-C subfamily serine protease
MLLLPGSFASAQMTATIDRVKPSIVAIGVFRQTDTPPFTFRGTGFAVSTGNVIATNAHVVPESMPPDGMSTLMIRTQGTSAAPQLRAARVLALDREHDLALLTIADAPLPAMALRNDPPPREGETVAFTGFPIGGALGFSPVTHRGMISAITPIVLPSPTAQQLNEKAIRRIRGGSFNILQLDATAYPGNSGSPLYDPASGEVLGIINMVFVKSTKENVLSQPSGITYAIPASFLLELLKSRP